MKKLQCYVASSFDELNKKCGYGVIMKEECRPIDIISGFTEESWQIKSYQVGGYLIGVLKGIQYAIDNNYDEVTIFYNFEGADKYTKIRNSEGLSEVVKTYLSGFKDLEQKIDIKFEKVNMNLFIPRTNLQRAYKISRKATQEEFDEFHILNKKNFKP